MVDGDFHSKHRDRLHHVVRKLEKSKEFVSKGLKDYLNQMIAICKEIERTNKSVRIIFKLQPFELVSRPSNFPCKPYHTYFSLNRHDLLYLHF